jgi:hypothetical protein
MDPMIHCCFAPLAVALCLAPLPSVAEEAEEAPKPLRPVVKQPLRPVPPVKRAGEVYPWHLKVTVAVFAIGGQKRASCWDSAWQEHFGGVDPIDPAARIADQSTGEFRPKAFVPKLNPFYVALPCNDVAGPAAHKPEAAKHIPWFEQSKPKPGKTVLKGRWVQIFNGKFSCYAQWEDAGPGAADEWDYVFSHKPLPANPDGSTPAGISISPAIRDYLKLETGQPCHWRFVNQSSVPYGAWKKHGEGAAAKDAAAQKAYTEYLQKLREEAAKRESGTADPAK